MVKIHYYHSAFNSKHNKTASFNTFNYFILLILMIFCFCPTVQASAVLWSEATVYLDTIAFTTTGDLNVSFLDGSPNGTLTCRDEVSYEEIRENKAFLGECPECKWEGGEIEGYTVIRKTWNLVSTGSGELSFRADFSWVFDSISSAAPEETAWGPDNVIIMCAINDSAFLGWFQWNAFPVDKFLFSPLWSSSQYFGNDEIESLSITIMTNANGAWLEKPIAPSPVPEPASILLASIGFTGFIYKGRSSKNK